MTTYIADIFTWQSLAELASYFMNCLGLVITTFCKQALQSDERLAADQKGEARILPI